MPGNDGRRSPLECESTPRLLVVDDDKAIRSLLTAVLSRKGYSVETARNGERSA